MKYLKGFMIAFVTVTIIIVGTFMFLPASVAKVTILNKSSEAIKSGQIKLCSEVTVFKNVSPDSEAMLKLNVKGDCHYEVNVQFESGKQISGEVGYTSSGADYEHEIIIFEDKVELGQTKIN